MHTNAESDARRSVTPDRTDIERAGLQPKRKNHGSDSDDNEERDERRRSSPMTPPASSPLQPAAAAAAAAAKPSAGSGRGGANFSARATLRIPAPDDDSTIRSALEQARRKRDGLPSADLGAAAAATAAETTNASVEPPPSPLSPASTSPSNGPQRSLGLKQCSNCSERCAPARKVCPSCGHPFRSRQSQSQSQSQSQTQLQLHKQRQQQQLLAIKQQQENAATTELGANEDEPDAEDQVAAAAELDEKEESGESDDGESADTSGELPPLLSLAAPAGVDLAIAAPASAAAADSGSLAAASTAHLRTRLSGAQGRHCPCATPRQSFTRCSNRRIRRQRCGRSAYARHRQREKKRSEKKNPVIV